MTFFFLRGDIPVELVKRIHLQTRFLLGLIYEEGAEEKSKKKRKS